MSPAQNDDAQIRNQSETCFELFIKISHSPHVPKESGLQNNISHGLEDAFSRFRLWISNIGVFADNHSSLDYRVREADEVKVLFLDQLEIIKCRLVQFDEIFAKNVPEKIISASNKADDLDISGNDTSSTTSNETNEPDCFNEWSPDELLGSIHRSIDWLQRLSNSIRRASSTSQNAKAKFFKIEDYTENGRITEEEVRLCFRATLGEICPGLQDDWMIDRLIETMVLRLKRVLYRRYRHAKWSFPYVQPPSLREAPSQPSRESYLRPQQVDASLSGTIMSKASPVIGRVVPALSVDSATTFNMSEWKRKPTYSRSVISTATSASTSSTYRLNLPPPPENIAAGENFICPYCGIVLKSDVGKSPRAWR
ncbi:hypothetical protein E8E14_002745 [Neopestalotiopsis sp. 37M]|nr:hypothetical protein E8E14_002745 [Neopestalotiopsis sp. 37M]